MYRNIPYSYYSGVPSPYDGYAQALAEEQAARDQYLNALQQQREAQDRAARARLARQAYDRSPYNSYLSSSDDEDFVTGSPFQSSYSNTLYEPNIPLSRGLGFYGISPQHQRGAPFEDQRRKEYQELQRAREKERLMRLVEEERRKQLVEEELRRRIREEERQRRIREEEELRRKILEEERARIEQEQLRQQRLSELEQLYRDFGFRPTVRSQPAEQPFRRARTMSPPHRQPSQTKPTSIRISTPSSPSPPSPTAYKQSERVSTPKSPTYTPEQIVAATKIQEFYRTRFPRFKSLKTLASVQAHFDSLKSSFTLPSQVDFKLDSSITSDNVLTVPTHSLPLPSLESLDLDELPSIPSLAYTPTNAPLHQYYEELNRLLTKLDAVESHGNRSVRDRRRELARMVEREAERVDRWKVAVWKAREGAEKEEHVQKETRSVAQDEETMPVDETSSTVEDASSSAGVIVPESSSASVAKPSVPEPEPMDVEPSPPVPEVSEHPSGLPSHDVEPTPLPNDSDISITTIPVIRESSSTTNTVTPRSPSPYSLNVSLNSGTPIDASKDAVPETSPPTALTLTVPLDDTTDSLTINLTTPDGDHVQLEAPEDDDALSDSETVVHSPVSSPNDETSDTKVAKPKKYLVPSLFDRDSRIFDEFVMI